MTRVLNIAYACAIIPSSGRFEVWPCLLQIAIYVSEDVLEQVHPYVHVLFLEYVKVEGSPFPACHVDGVSHNSAFFEAQDSSAL